MPLSQSNKTVFQYIRPLLFCYKGRLFLAFFALLVASASTLALPKWVGIISDALSDNNVEGMHAAFIQLIGIVVVMALSTAYRFYNISWLGERVVTDIRKQLFSHLLVLPKSFYDSNQSGELISRITTDTTLVERVIGTSLSMALRNILLVLGSLAMLLYTSVKLTLLVLIVTPVAIIPSLGILRKSRQLSSDSQAFVAKGSAFCSQVLSSMDITKAYQYEKSAIATFSGISEKGFLVSKRRINTRSLLTAVMLISMLLAMVSIIWVGMLAVIKGDISSGQLGQFFMYAVFMASGLANLSEVWGDVNRGIGAMDRIMEILSVEAQSDDGDLSSESTEIEFQEVRFAYPSRDHMEVLHGVSLNIMPKQLTAIVGPSGAGKSSLFKLLMRYYPQKSGKISIGGVEIEKLSLQNLRGMIAYVGHDAGIFPASVKENLSLGKIYSDVELMRAAEKANIADFISTLPDGYDTELGEKGVLLSEGQRQRIALARAILRDAPIILLDEATNALDAITEEAINHALTDSFKDKTVLVIAHRLATVLSADQIIVMDQGEIEATGTHKSLLKSSKTYAQLAKIQLLS